MGTGEDLGGIRYTSLCPEGTRRHNIIDNAIGRRRKVAYLLMNAEEEHPTDAHRYRLELEALKEEIRDGRGVLMQHVAHCGEGCARDTSSGLSVSAFSNAGAPVHKKPALPRMSEIAARLREGEALDAIGAEYDRSADTLRGRLAAAGFSSRTGKPLTPPPAPARTVTVRPVVVEEPWRKDAVCAQTDPESFFPEKGGSTREAKSVCASCTASAECLDYAIDNHERFGIWGGLSERERRKVAAALRAPAPDLTPDATAGINLDQESA